MTYTYQKNDAGLFVCPHCAATKKRQNTMFYHLKRHEDKLPHTCPHCKKEFLHAGTLALHISARHAKQQAATLACPCCPFRTLTRSNRIIHYVRHHAVEAASRLRSSDQGGQLACRACQKLCQSDGAFYYHIATSGCLHFDSASHAAELAAVIAPPPFKPLQP